MKPNPPYYPLRFLRWFCREDCLEEIEGDLVEIFEKQYEHSPRKARWKFTWSTARYFRPGFIKSFKANYNTNTIAMFRHNLLLTYRIFIRYKSSFFINLAGLSVGLATALLIFLWIHDELSIDKFHDKDERLYQVLENWEFDSSVHTAFETSGPVAEALRSNMPGVEYATAMAPATWPGFDGFALSVEEVSIRAAGQFVEKDYFNIFSFELIRGDKDQVLKDKSSIVLSEPVAVKLFQTTENVVGKTVTFQQDRQFIVSGIFKGTPPNSSVQFDFVLSFEVLKEMKPWVDSWGSTGPAVYVVLKDGTDVRQFNRKLATFVRQVTKGEETTRTIFLQHYSDLYLYGIYENGMLVGGRIEYVRLFSVVAFAILLIACINFMNLSTARASRRMKEVGVKKVVGAGRKTLIFQYMGESILMAFLSLVLAVIIAVLFLPRFNEIAGKQLMIGFDQYQVLSILAITLLSGIIAGSYPALYLSGYRPIRVLKGALNHSTSAIWARKGLVIFQFTVSVILITGVWVIYNQVEYIRQQNLGYDREHVAWLTIEGRVKGNTDTFLSEVKNIPGVVNAAATAHNLIGHSWSMQGMEWAGGGRDDQVTFQIAGVDYNFIEMMGLEITAGRSFSKDRAGEKDKIIFNEAAIDAMGLVDPVGSTVNFFMGTKEIIGVVKNFHFESLHEELKPLFFILLPNALNRIMIKMEAGKEKEVISRLRGFYETYNPGFVFDYRFLDDDYQAQYAAEQRISTLCGYFAAIAIFISCLGLFGLTAFTAERRTKEIGIRKILGASNGGIIRLLSTNFTKMIIVAITIGLPASYFITRKWLEGFAFRIELEWWYFAGSGLAALFIAWSTVWLQAVKATRIDPVECLKDE